MRLKDLTKKYFGKEDFDEEIFFKEKEEEIKYMEQSVAAQLQQMKFFGVSIDMSKVREEDKQ